MLNNCDRALHELMLAKQFSCVLKKDVDEVSTRELFFALMRFLRCHYPDDKDSMRMVYICFNMQREVASQLVMHVTRYEAVRCIVNELALTCSPGTCN